MPVPDQLVAETLLHNDLAPSRSSVVRPTGAHEPAIPASKQQPSREGLPSLLMYLLRGSDVQASCFVCVMDDNAQQHPCGSICAKENSDRNKKAARMGACVAVCAGAGIGVYQLIQWAVKA